MCGRLRTFWQAQRLARLFLSARKYCKTKKGRKRLRHTEEKKGRRQDTELQKPAAASTDGKPCFSRPAAKSGGAAEILLRDSTFTLSPTRQRKISLLPARQGEDILFARQGKTASLHTTENGKCLSPTRQKKKTSPCAARGKHSVRAAGKNPLSLHTTEEGKCLSPTRRRKSNLLPARQGENILFARQRKGGKRTKGQDP